MSGDLFASEVKLLHEYGMTHTGLIYAIGSARAITNLKLSVLLKVLKDLREADLTDEQLMQLSAVLSRGKIGEAKALVSSFKVESPEKFAELRKSTQFDILKDCLEKNAAFTEVIEVKGKVLARNPNTGEVVSPSHAARVMRQSQEAIAKAESEKRPGSDDFLASRLQATVVVEYSNLLGPDDSEITCDVCKQPIPEDDLLPLDACGHLMHATCILNHILTQINFPLTCPYSNCLVEISTLDLVERLSPEDMSLYEQNSFNHYVQHHTGDMQSCPTPNCSFVFEWSGDGPEFNCPLCSKSYCLICRAGWHSGLTCEQFRLRSETSHIDLAYESLAHNKRFKQCVYCLNWVEKELGTNVLNCRCGNTFCFKCGEEQGVCNCKKRPKTPSYLSGYGACFM